MITLRRGDTYLLGIPMDELRTEACAGGCGQKLTISTIAYTEARQVATNEEGRNGSVGVVCRKCWQTASEQQASGLLLQRGAGR